MGYAAINQPTSLVETNLVKSKAIMHFILLSLIFEILELDQDSGVMDIGLFGIFFWIASISRD